MLNDNTNIAPKAGLQWTQEQGIAYEALRETINHYLGLVHHEIYTAEPQPRQMLLRALGQHAIDVTQERDTLDITDDEAVSAIQAKYSDLIAGWKQLP